MTLTSKRVRIHEEVKEFVDIHEMGLEDDLKVKSKRKGLQYNDIKDDDESEDQGISMVL